ncbi:hypothetical protein C8R42DRAFT_640721 [Lentinula raphanica]|nr:hypothetical protein C8R42DRAFT_649356 [Lentinula raphanica]KAJ3724798.1 hypothetical protein C8R42DRAFT_640721 [Lentinula raphanica]
MGYRKTAPDERSISSLLNPVAPPQSNPSSPSPFFLKNFVPVLIFLVALVKFPTAICSSILEVTHPVDACSTRITVVRGHRKLRIVATIVRENLFPSRAFNPGDPPYIASSPPNPFRDYESYVDGVYNSTAYASRLMAHDSGMIQAAQRNRRKYFLESQIANRQKIQ